MSLNNVEKFRKKIEQGHLCIGSAILLADAAVSELHGDAGYDFLWIDGEHGPMDLPMLLAHVMAARGTDAAPFVRVPANDPVRIKPVLDLAPAGIIVPTIGSAEDAARAVRACKYPPKGVRGYGPRRGNAFGAISQQDYLKFADEQSLVILQIETKQAVEEIDGILATPGVDAICLGPNDLSGSLGNPRHPDVVAAMETVAKAAAGTDVALGLATGYDPDWLRRWLDRGVQWLCLNNDHANLYTQVKAVLDGARRLRD